MEAGSMPFIWCYSDIEIKGDAISRGNKGIQISCKKQKQMFRTDRKSKPKIEQLRTKIQKEQ